MSDIEDILKMGGASSLVIVCVGLAYKIVTNLLGKRIRSKCCGHTAEVQITIDTPSRDSVSLTPISSPSPQEVPVPQSVCENTPSPPSRRASHLQSSLSSNPQKEEHEKEQSQV